MPDLKISQLTAGGAAQAADEFPIARAGGNAKITGANIAAAATSVGTLTANVAVTKNAPTITLTGTGSGTDQALTLVSNDGLTSRIFQGGSATTLAGGLGLQANANRTIQFLIGSTMFWQVNSSGHFLAGADATYDIGASGANRPRDLFIARDLNVDGGTLFVNGTSNWVGIGTTTSLTRGGLTGALQVQGTIRASGGFSAQFDLGTIANGTTVSTTVTNGLHLLTNGANTSALILVTVAGGSTGVQMVYGTGSDVVVGGTTEPAGGTYLRVWMSGSGGTLQVKNVNAGYSGPYYITPLATFST